MEKEKRKNNTGFIITIILLIVLVLGLVFYICYDKGIIFKPEDTTIEEKEKNESNNKNDTWEDIALDDERFYSLYTTLKGFTYDKSRGAGYKDFNSHELAILAYGTADVKKEDFKEINTLETGGIKATFDANIVTTEINEIFNTNISINYNKVKDVILYSAGVEYGLKVSDSYPSTCGFEIESYNPSTNQIVAVFIAGCGGTSGPGPKITERKIVSAKKNDDTIVVEEKAIYTKLGTYTSNHNNYHYSIYSDNSHINYITTISGNDNTISNMEINVDSYIDQASTITHTYKLNKDTNKYYFVSSVIS